FWIWGRLQATSGLVAHLWRWSTSVAEESARCLRGRGCAGFQSAARTRDPGNRRPDAAFCGPVDLGLAIRAYRTDPACRFPYAGVVSFRGGDLREGRHTGDLRGTSPGGQYSHAARPTRCAVAAWPGPRRAFTGYHAGQPQLGDPPIGAALLAGGQAAAATGSLAAVRSAYGECGSAP